MLRAVSSPPCEFSSVPKGFFFGSIHPYVMIEIEITSTDRLSISFYFGLSKRIIFHSGSIAYGFNPETCDLDLGDGAGYWREFGGSRLEFKSPQQIMTVLREEIPENISSQLSNVLGGRLTDKGLRLMNIFVLPREEGPQDWLQLLETAECSMTDEERREIIAMQHPSVPVGTVARPSMDTQIQADAAARSASTAIVTAMSFIIPFLSFTAC